MTRNHEFPLGRIEPTDFEHVERYPYGAVAPATVEHVERLLKLPGWHLTHDQGREGSCVGHAVAMERAITNRMQLVVQGVRHPVRYDPIALWRAAKAVDEFPSTKPQDSLGTSVRAAYQVTRDTGLSRVTSMKLVADQPTPVGAQPLDVHDGVDTYRWATSVDEVRTAIAQGLPVVLGINWYLAFDDPKLTIRTGDRDASYWLPDVTGHRTTVQLRNLLGRIRGGHSVCVYGASDKRNAVRVKNSWGRDYPLVWLPYPTLERLIAREHGEAALVSDR